MSYLKQYVEHLNLFRSYSNGTKYDVNNLTQKDVRSIAFSLEADMSPENLHCDGEISVSAARQKARYYGKVFRELTETARQSGFQMPHIWGF